jgi:hypothetical protein
VVTTTNMAIIFFIFGVTLDTSELLLALKAWKAIIFGLVSMLVICPLFGFICMLLPFKPYEFALGLAVMACVPTSLSSGVTLVIGAYGNGALALLFTVSGKVSGGDRMKGCQPNGWASSAATYARVSCKQSAHLDVLAWVQLVCSHCRQKLLAVLRPQQVA